MLQKLHSLKSAAPKTVLTEAERSHMKAEFVAYMDMHAPVPHQAPAEPRNKHVWRTVRSFAALVPIFCLAMLGYAAERSLPQDPLYRVKTMVTEPLLLKGASFTPRTYARAETLIVQRRLREAEQLAAHQHGTPESFDFIASAINERVLSIQKYAVPQDSDDLSAQLQITSTLENTLDSSTIVLQTVAPSSNQSVGDLIENISVHSSSTAVIGDQLEEALAETRTDEAATYVTELEDLVEEKLDAVDNLIDEAVREGTDPLLSKAAHLHEDALHLQSSSTAYEQTGDASRNLSALQDAFESLEQAEMLISAEERLDQATQ